jgi:hypothetical protein
LDVKKRFSEEIIGFLRDVFSNRGNGPCYSCLYDDQDECLGDSAVHGALLLGDAKRGDWQRVALKRDPDCAICAGR